MGGIAVFLLGLQFVSNNLQNILGNRMRDAMQLVSKNKFYGVGVGVLLTAMIQSSGAVTSLLVGLGSAGTISLSQVMSVILGVTIGTTLVVQLLSFKITAYGLAIFAISFVVYFLTSKPTLKKVMAVFMGFGMMFWGLELVSIGTIVLKENELFREALIAMSESPTFTIMITAFLTAVMHSSAATIGFAIALSMAGAIQVDQAIFWVYGANIGTTATALIASSGSNYVGKQVAWAHCLYKVAGVLLFIGITPYFVGIVKSGDAGRSIANAHTLFNVIVAIVFFPFIQYGAKFIEKVIQPTDADREFGVKYLDRSVFENSTVALSYVQREILRMGDIVASMVETSIELFKNQDDELEERIHERDNRVDLLFREIQSFLADVHENFDSVSSKKVVKLMMFASDLESAADVIDNTILELARKKHGLKLEFSPEGWQEIRNLHDEVCQIVNMSLSCFQTQNLELADRIIEAKRKVRKLEKEFKKSHLNRFLEGNPDTLKTSTIHLDALNEYRRVVGLVTNHVYPLRKSGEKKAKQEKGQGPQGLD
tara:strand:+ start:79748 stop:81370 length:1623 start_codon:yes stop_codon:yes gene_type:complete